MASDQQALTDDVEMDKQKQMGQERSRYAQLIVSNVRNLRSIMQFFIGVW